MVLMVGPRDGFKFETSEDLEKLTNSNIICVQCQAGQHAKCLAKNSEQERCDCELCLFS